LLCALRYDLFWRKFYGLLRRICIVLLSDEIFCRHQLGPFALSCHLIYCVDDLSIGDRGVLKSPTNTALQSICTFKSFSVW
jgi:hypothetical protein